MAAVENLERLQSEDLGCSERAEVAISTVSAYLVDPLEAGLAESPVEEKRQPVTDRLIGIWFVITCAALELIWLGCVGYLVYASGVLEALFLSG